MKDTTNLMILILPIAGILYCETSYIQIIAEPGLKVFLDGLFKGETISEMEGLIIDDVTEGRHKIKIVKLGFVEQEEEINIEPGAVLVYKVKPFIPKLTIIETGKGQESRLTKKSGTLKIQSRPISISIKIKTLFLKVKLIRS